MTIATKLPSTCRYIQDQFSGYLDGMVSGKVMQQIAAHLRDCAGCTEDFAAWQSMIANVSSIGPARAPKDLALRLRVALSQAAAQTPRAAVDRWRIQWTNVYRPLALQATAGLASALCLIGTVAMLVGMFAAPQPVEARDEPLTFSTGPRFLYTSVQPDALISDRTSPIIVEAFISNDGRVYDYRIVSGEANAEVRAHLDDTLLFSLFEPARSLGIPVRGTVVMSFSGISVKG
jgi:hypothetical protein